MCDNCVLKAAHVLSALLAASETTPTGHDEEDAVLARQMCQDINIVLDWIKPAITSEIAPHASTLVDQMLVMGPRRVGNLVRLAGMWLHLLESVNRLGVATLTALAEKGDPTAITWLLIHGSELVNADRNDQEGTAIVVEVHTSPTPSLPFPPRRGPQHLN